MFSLIINMLRKKANYVIRNPDESEETLHELINEFDNKEKEFFSVVTYVKYVSSKAPGVFTDEMKKKVVDEMKGAEKTLPRASLAICIHNLVEEFPESEILIPGIEEAVKMREDYMEKNPRDELLTIYYGLYGWIDTSHEIPKEIIEKVVEGKRKYDSTTFSAMAFLLAESIINKDDSRKLAFEKLENLMDSTNDSDKLESLVIAMISCVNAGALDEEAVMNKVNENNRKLNEKTKELYREALR